MNDSGRIIILNGAPRAGKSTLATAIQQTFPGEWAIFGVDAFQKILPPSLYPGIGLRPFVEGDASPVAPLVPGLYRAFHRMLRGLADAGVNVVADVGYHDAYAQPLEDAREVLGSFLFVGVRCPLDEILRRRGEAVHPGILAWQELVHEGKVYDLEVDTSLLTPEEGAAAVFECFRNSPTPARSPSQSLGQPF